ncbi:MAG: hypothetical protein ACR2N4_00040 [Jatrophihabitans sp.]
MLALPVEPDAVLPDAVADAEPVVPPLLLPLTAPELPEPVLTTTPPVPAP